MTPLSASETSGFATTPRPWPPSGYPGQQAAGYPGQQAAGYPGQQAAGYPPGWPVAAPPPGGYAYPGAAAPKRSRTTIIVSTVAAVVVLACLGFGGVTFFALRHLDSARSANASLPTGFPTDLPTDEPTDQPSASGPTHGGDLKQYLIARPATAHPMPKVKAEQALDLTAAAANFGNPTEGKLILQRYGFKDGYTRRWIDDQGSFVVVRILRFADTGGGNAFKDFYVAGNQIGGWGDPKDVPGVPDGAVFVKPKPEKDGFQRTLAVGDSGDIVAMVLADQLPPARAATPEGLLVKEFGKL